MSNDTGRLTDDDLRITRDHLAASKQVIDQIPDRETLRAILQDVLDLSIGLIDQQRRERVEEPATPPAVAAPELLAALVRIAEIAEGHWLQLSKNDKILADGKYRHHVMSKLGNALREYRLLTHGSISPISAETPANGAPRGAEATGTVS